MTELVKMAQQGDSAAFEKLVKEYDSRVLSLAYQISGNRQDAEDIYQEVFMRVYRKIKSFKGDCSFYTWLYRITVNCSLTFIGKRKRMSHAPIEGSGAEHFYQAVDSGPLPDQEVVSAEMMDRVRRCVDELPLQQRSAFVLRFFHHQKIKEVAWIMGCSEGTVKNYIHRSTMKVKEKVALLSA